MMGIVPGLSPQDIADLAAWFSTQSHGGGVADEAQVALGERIFRAGNMPSPACRPAWPATVRQAKAIRWRVTRPLAGQHAVYTGNMLNRFRSGENWGEDDASSQVMNGVAAELTDEEIAAVASYIQGLYLRAE